MLSEFLKAPSENMGGRQHVFRDPTNPLVKVSIHFTRKWERPKDMWSPDLEHVYVDTNLKLVLRPDDSKRRDGSGKEYDSSWKYIQVPVTWQHLMVEHLLFTSAVSIVDVPRRRAGFGSSPVLFGLRRSVSYHLFHPHEVIWTHSWLPNLLAQECTDPDSQSPRGAQGVGRRHVQTFGPEGRSLCCHQHGRTVHRE